MQTTIAGSTNAWHDIESFTNLMEIKFTGLETSANAIEDIIEKEINNIASRKIILAGFSQGGALSLYSGLTSKFRLGGIVCLSGYLPKFETLEDKLGPNKNTRVFMGHGSSDNVVNI
jgi:predicted esterase